MRPRRARARASPEGAARRGAAGSREAALKSELAATQDAFATQLSRSHETKLALQQAHDAALRVAPRPTVFLFFLRAAGDGRRARARPRVHDAKKKRRRAKDAELRASEARAAETAAAFTDYMARKQVELTERTLALQAAVEAKDRDLAAARAEVEEVVGALNEHVGETDDLIERQGDELRKQREALQTVIDCAWAGLPKDAKK